jgi:hypothetical protein
MTKPARKIETRESDGRIAPSNLKNMCVCGHKLGKHTAGRPARHGRPASPRVCLCALDEEYSDKYGECNCEGFKKAE